MSVGVNPTVRAPKYRRLVGVGSGPVTVDSTIAGSDSANTMLVDSQPVSGVKAFRQGALKATLTRAAAEADTTWDGNPDTAFTATARNNATGNLSNQGAIRGANIQGRNDGTNISWVLGLNLNGRNSSGKTADQVHGLDVRCEQYGTVSTELVGIDVNLSDESAANAHVRYGMRVRNTDQSAQSAATACVHTSHTSTNGFSHFLHAAATGDGVTTGNSDALNGLTGTARLLVKIGSTAFYAPLVAV